MSSERKGKRLYLTYFIGLGEDRIITFLIYDVLHVLFLVNLQLLSDQCFTSVIIYHVVHAKRFNATPLIVKYN